MKNYEFQQLTNSTCDLESECTPHEWCDPHDSDECRPCGPHDCGPCAPDRGCGPCPPTGSPCSPDCGY